MYIVRAGAISEPNISIQDTNLYVLEKEPGMESGDLTADVIVVGGGIGGLSAARSLSAKGLSVIVLEARGRVGGRLLTISDSGNQLDMGATWFWPNEPRILQLIKDLGLETFPQHISGDAMFETRDGTERLRGNPIDVPSGRFVEGAQSLADAIARELVDGCLRFNEPVIKIEAEEDKIKAHTNSRIYTGENLVLAIPPVLAVRDIEFLPALPEELTELAGSHPYGWAQLQKLWPCTLRRFGRAMVCRARP